MYSVQHLINKCVVGIVYVRCTCLFVYAETDASYRTLTNSDHITNEHNIQINNNLCLYFSISLCVPCAVCRVRCFFSLLFFCLILLRTICVYSTISSSFYRDFKISAFWMDHISKCSTAFKSQAARICVLITL